MGPGQPCQPPDGSMEPGDWRPGVFVSLAAYTLYTPHADVRLPLLTCSSSVSLLKRSQPWQIRQQRQCCCINCPTGTPSGSSGRSFPQCLGPPRWSARARSRVWKKKEKKTQRKLRGVASGLVVSHRDIPVFLTFPTNLIFCQKCGPVAGRPSASSRVWQYAFALGAEGRQNIRSPTPRSRRLTGGGCRARASPPPALTTRVSPISSTENSMQYTIIGRFGIVSRAALQFL